MSIHRYDKNISELTSHFTSVIEWISAVFIDVVPEMKGLEWGRLYEQFHANPFDPQKISADIQHLLEDPSIKRRKGIFEYVLGGLVNTRLLQVRIFDEVTKRATYQTQTRIAKESSTSNCPLCSIGMDSNQSKIWALKDMDADHVEALVAPC